MLALMPLVPVLCVCENVEYHIQTCLNLYHIAMSKYFLIDALYIDIPLLR